MRPGDHDDIESGRAQRLDQAAYPLRAGRTIRHQGAIPICDAGLETPVEFNGSCHRMIVHREALARHVFQYRRLNLVTVIEVGLDKTFLREF